MVENITKAKQIIIIIIINPDHIDMIVMTIDTDIKIESMIREIEQDIKEIRPKKIK